MSKAASDTLEKVSGEFEKEALSDLEATRTETLAKLEAVRKETEEAVSKILETGIKQAEAVKRQIIGAAELEARNIQLKALEKAVNESFDAASNQISELKGTSYDKAMERLIQEGLEVIGPKAKVQCSPKDKRVVASIVKKLSGKEKVSMDDNPVETMGGVVLTTPDESVRFDNTFEARLERMRPNLRQEVAAILTGER
jgi:V/A-type H+/Na+-transporting ATPase subunit E